ncbi:unnamed protein product [Closterium sp. NIES-53]
MAEQQVPSMQGMNAGSFNAAPPPPQYAAPAPSNSAGADGCCANNKRSALYTWLPFGLRIGLFCFCLVAFSLLFSTKATVTAYSAGAFLVGMVILGFILAVMLFVYNSVRMCVAGSESYDWLMDIVQFFESYVSPSSRIMSLLLFAAATSGAAACNTWWNTSTLSSFLLGDITDISAKDLLDLSGYSYTSTAAIDSKTLINQYVDTINADLSKVRGACAMAYFATFIYIAMFWYYTIRMYKRGVLKAIADAAVPAAVKDNVPPYNV